MHKRSVTFITLILLITSCVDVSTQAKATKTPAPPLFVTSTLPSTKPGLTIPTQVPPTGSPTQDPSITATPKPACRDSAALVIDVTYPDNAIVNAGEPFTKTWELQNAGSCDWSGYTVAFVDGERMGSPDSVPVPETERGNAVEVSVELIAPSADGTYRGNFELRNEEGESVSMGSESIFWVQIVVGTGGFSDVLQNGNCNYSTNDEYVQQLIDLINQARTEVGRAELTVNPTLMSAAQAHSLDMACNNFFLHSGSDGSWIGDRLTSAGYTNPYYLELLAIGLPGDAINQWKTHPKAEWELVINSRVTEIGVGYVYSKFSSYGGYWTVDMGGP